MTLIEIMVVLVILGLIAGAIGFNVFSNLKEAQIKSAKLDLQGPGQRSGPLPRGDRAMAG